MLLSVAHAHHAHHVRTPLLSGSTGLDRTVFLDVIHFAQATPWLHTFAIFWADYGIVLLGVLLVAGWWSARRRGPRVMAAALWAGLGTLAAVGISEPLRQVVAEARPWQAMPHLVLLTGRSYRFSFPSDHAVVAGAVMAGLFVVSRRLTITAAVAGALISLARIYTGSHFPQDVAAGLALGVVVVLAGYALLRVPLTALVTSLGRTRLRPLLAAAPAAPGARGFVDRTRDTAGPRSPGAEGSHPSVGTAPRR